jgi:hypothetical protein
MLQIGLHGLIILLCWGPAMPIAELARRLDCARATIRRRVKLATDLVRWARGLTSGAAVCSWDQFTSLVSRAFFPHLAPDLPTNT